MRPPREEIADNYDNAKTPFLNRPLGALLPTNQAGLTMEKTNPADFSAIAISVFIGTAIMLIFHLFFIDSWSNDHKFILASILAIAGFLILRRMRNKTRKHRFFYLTVGNVLLGVGVAIITIPLINWITERMVS